MGELLQFRQRENNPSRTAPTVTGEDVFKSYILQSENWKNEGYWKTLYKGYPFSPPCEPYREDMKWYVNESGASYGVWVLRLGDSSSSDRPCWSPFVRKSNTPPFEPLNIPDVSTRKKLTWIVEEDGFGQYGMVMEDGYVWIPQPRPEGWEKCEMLNQATNE